MKKCLTIFFLLSVLMFSFNIVSAEKVQTNVNTQTGLQVFAPQFEATKYNTAHTLHIHISNLSNGYPLQNTVADCYLHLYGMKGGHLFESEALEKDTNGWDYEIEIAEGNFTEAGEYNGYYVWCNNTAENLGGEVKGIYEITANGRITPDGIIILGFILIMLTIFILLTGYLVRAVGLIVEASFDIMDIAYAWGLFFGLLGIRLFAGIYLGNIEVNDFLDLLIKILAFPFVIVPVVAFFLSLFRTKKKEKEKKAEW